MMTLNEVTSNASYKPRNPERKFETILANGNKLECSISDWGSGYSIGSFGISGLTKNGKRWYCFFSHEAIPTIFSRETIKACNEMRSLVLKMIEDLK